MTWASALYAGTVTHRRLRPRRHAFSYRIFWLLIDLDELPMLDRSLRFFSWRRFNLFSFDQRDHGSGAADLRAHLLDRLAEAGIEGAIGSIRLLCCPRVLGYVFNPISVFLFHRPDGGIAATLYEVNNTFGDRHSYLVPGGCDAEGLLRHQYGKRLHVSPFMGMDMSYRFALLPPGQKVVLHIDASDSEGKLLHAAFTGSRRDLTDASILAAALRYPLVTLKITAAIHWEAARLFVKRVPFHRRPPPPAALSVGESRSRVAEADHAGA